MSQNNEVMYAKFIVLKVEDLEECLTDEQIESMKGILDCVRTSRLESGRNPEPTYYVINTDEHYADKVKQIIENNEIGEAD